MEDQVKQFDEVSDSYAHFVDEDPVRNFLHYPSIIAFMGDIAGKKILDIGCGDGLFDRKLARDHRAHLVGYDKAPELIAIAEREEKSRPFGIRYEVADPKIFDPKEIFDLAVSVMVLSYAPDEDYLGIFFVSACQSLKTDGIFTSIIFNPEFNAFDKKVANRKFRKIEGNKVEVNFLDIDGNVKLKATLSQFTKEAYEVAAKSAGFKEVHWEKLYPTENGKKKMSDDFWRACEQEQPYALLIVKK